MKITPDLNLNEIFCCIKSSAERNQAWMDGWMDGWMSVCLSVWLCLSVCLSACLSVCKTLISVAKSQKRSFQSRLILTYQIFPLKTKMYFSLYFSFSFGFAKLKMSITFQVMSPLSKGRETLCTYCLISGNTKMIQQLIKVSNYVSRLL